MNKLPHMKTIRIKNTLQDVSAAVAQVDEQLRKYKVGVEDRARSTLMLEESLVRIVESTASSEVKIFVSIRRGINSTDLRVTVKCPEIQFVSDSLLGSSDILSEEYGPETEALIRDLILRNGAERLRTHYSKGVNRVDILVSRNDKAMIYKTLAALVLGLGSGFAVRMFCSPEVGAGLNEYLFSPLYSLFLTAIAMIMVPMVFFSLATSVAGFGDMSALGRTGGKVFGTYFLTTAIAIGVAIGMNYLLVPGRPGMMVLPEAGADAEPTIRLSLMDKLMSIIPDNFIGAFSSADMLQVMFLAVLLGIACTQIGKFSQPVKNAIDALSAWFSRATSIISGFLPYAIFGAMAQMALKMDVGGIGALASWVGVLMLCLVVQLVVYMLLLWLVARVNPFVFLRKFLPASMTAFFTSSSSAAIPTSMDCCQKMGISRKVYSFSIPLGANINMDGLSVCFVITTLFVAGLYGVSVSAAEIISLITSVMLISIAIPGVPGAGTACILMLFAIVGVPPEAFGLVIGLMPILELFETSLNVTGDGVVTAIVAKSEGEMDTQQYYAK